MTIKTPDWVKSAVFYQIFPDRFCRGSTAHFPQGIELLPWGTSPEQQGFQGGDLYGIVEKLDYLNDLGITALYLNPIFSSASNHRYHTFDYMQVDPLLGGNEALRLLLDEAHARSMRVVLDGVFNHASRGFWAFHHILENGDKSPYLDWFHIDDFPLRPYPESAKDEINYRAWWDLPALPKFNTDNVGVRDYLFSVAEYWIRFGIDGWRLDVPTEIDDDSFWQEFRTRVKALNPEAYICGEIWHKAQRWLQGDQFDAVMNYPIGTAALAFFGRDVIRSDYEQNHLQLEPINAEEFCQRVEDIYSWYHEDINAVQFNLLDSHDMPRAKWLLNENTDALKLALSFLMSVPGTPCIYYGTEVGMTGGTDPDCRRAFPWSDAAQWPADIADVVRKHAWVKSQFPAFSNGQYKIEAVTEAIIKVTRHVGSQKCIVLLNQSSDAVTLRDEWLEECARIVVGVERVEKILPDSKKSLSAFSTEVFVI